ncbi:MAG: MOSC domain-containing protein [Burkholderiales bacterium]|nr:MOSC domain-containing protein [Burkholderiales bacterium]
MTDQPSPIDVTVDGLFTYPVKGMRGVTLNAATVAVTGTPHDRRWMLVDSRRTPAQFLSQRELPDMATLAASVDASGELTLSRPGVASISIRTSDYTSSRHVKVWSFDTLAEDAGDVAAHWCATALGQPVGSVRLVRFDTARTRLCSVAYSGESGAHTWFADGYPVLVTNTASLDNLNARIVARGGAPLPMDRFRPNVVVRGLPAWDEDFVDTLAIGAVALKLVKPCVRCLVTATNQQSGRRLSSEPLDTLATFRNNPDLGGVTFGWNAIVVAAGDVRTGMPVRTTYRF